MWRRTEPNGVCAWFLFECRGELVFTLWPGHLLCGAGDGHVSELRLRHIL